MVKKKVPAAKAGKTKSPPKKAVVVKKAVDTPPPASVAGKTRFIQIRAFNNARKVLGHIERTFDKVGEARAWLFVLTGDDANGAKTMKELAASRDGTVATINKLELELNYNIRDLIAGEEPDGLLPEMRNFGSGLKKPDFNKSSAAAPVSGDTPKTSAAPVVKSTKSKSSGAVVVLKEICKEMDVDPAKARIRLRKLQRDNALPPEAEGGRWQWSRENAEKVKSLLGGK